MLHEIVRAPSVRAGKSNGLLRLRGSCLHALVRGEHMGDTASPADKGPPLEPAAAPSPRALRCLLASHALAVFSWRSWEFTLALLLTRLYPDSLAVVSLYGLADSGASLLAGPALGRAVDRRDRRSAALRGYAAQHCGIALSCLLSLAALAAQGGARAALTACLFACAALAGVGSTGSSLSVEREWGKTLCGGDEHALTRLNGGMRALDLSAALLAPAAAGAVLQLAGPRPACLLLGCLNAACFWPESRLLAMAQAAAPVLAAPRQPPAAPSSGPGLRAVALYLAQPALQPALSLALLYLTVLSMGFLMTAYLHAAGLADLEIALLRAAGSLTGLLATVGVPSLAPARMSLRAVAALALLYQLLWITLGAAPVLLGAADGGSRSAARWLAVAVALSRTGLWGADLAIGQLLQQEVPPEALGAINGVQGSLCAAFEIAAYLAGLLANRPARFPALMAGSLGSVGLSAALFLRHLHRHRAAAAAAAGGELAALEEPLLEETF